MQPASGVRASHTEALPSVPADDAPVPVEPSQSSCHRVRSWEPPTAPWSSSLVSLRGCPSVSSGMIPKRCQGGCAPVIRHPVGVTVSGIILVPQTVIRRLARRYGMKVRGRASGACVWRSCGWYAVASCNGRKTAGKTHSGMENTRHPKLSADRLAGYGNNRPPRREPRPSDLSGHASCRCPSSGSCGAGRPCFRQSGDNLQM